jgi:hypothetical protein
MPGQGGQNYRLATGGDLARRLGAGCVASRDEWPGRARGARPPSGPRALDRAAAQHIGHGGQGTGQEGVKGTKGWRHRMD